MNDRLRRLALDAPLTRFHNSRSQHHGITRCTSFEVEVEIPELLGPEVDLRHPISRWPDERVTSWWDRCRKTTTPIRDQDLRPVARPGLHGNTAVATRCHTGRGVLIVEGTGHGDTGLPWSINGHLRPQLRQVKGLIESNFGAHRGHHRHRTNCRWQHQLDAHHSATTTNECHRASRQGTLNRRHRYRGSIEFLPIKRDFHRYITRTPRYVGRNQYSPRLR